MTSKLPIFIYSMVPLGNTAYRDFFDSGPLKSLLEDPGQLRYAGWDLTTRDRTRIVKGEYLELKNAERKRLRLYEDGSFFVRVAADQEYLSWGMNEANFIQTPRLNTLAVIEFSLNFCKLCSSLVKYMDPEPSQIDLKIEIRNAFFGESKLFLIPHPVSTNWFSFSDDRHIAPESSTTRQIRVPTEQLESRPDVVAFLLVRQIFLWFGVAAEMIPYVSAEGNLKFVDEDKIRNSRSS